MPLPLVLIHPLPNLNGWISKIAVYITDFFLTYVSLLVMIAHILSQKLHLKLLSYHITNGPEPGKGMRISSTKS